MNPLVESMSGRKLEIYEIINQLTGAGKAVVLVSSEPS